MKYVLCNMLHDLQQYKQQDKGVLMQKYVSQRLDKSFDVYNQELKQSILFLKSKHEKSLIKRMKSFNDKLD